METQSTNSKGSKYHVSWEEINRRLKEFEKKALGTIVYGVPKNGMILCAFLPKVNESPSYDGFIVSQTPDCADIILDDVIDSGRTRNRFKKKFPNKRFYALYNKREEKLPWLVFPWEDEEWDIEDLVVRQLEYIGEDPDREGLKNTPERVVKSWGKLFSGYTQNTKDIIKTFREGTCDEMVVLKNISFYSTCEHHILPFFGKVSIGYIPDKKIVGISKLARIVEIYCRRLQIQERMTAQIADFIWENLKPRGVMVIVKAQHLCMMARGIEKQDSTMVTSAIRGVFKEDQKPRMEFMEAIK